MHVTNIVVSLGGKIPAQRYGNIEMNFIWSAALTPEDNPEDATRDLVSRVRAQVMEAVAPVVEAKVKAALPLLKDIAPAARDARLREIGIVDWVTNLVPDIALIAAPTTTDPAPSVAAPDKEKANAHQGLA